MTDPNKHTRKFWPYLLFAPLVLLGLWFITRHYINLETVKQLVLSLRSNEEISFPLIVGAIVAVQIVSMTLSLPTKAIFTILAGALLGTIGGIVTTLLGVLLGTSILFYGTRRLFRKKVEQKFKARALQLEARLVRHPIISILGLRLVITLPYGPITLAAALTTIRYRDFIIGSLLGDLPVVFLYSLAGSQIASLTNTSEAFSTTTLIILISTGLVLVASSLAARRKDIKPSSKISAD